MGRILGQIEKWRTSQFVFDCVVAFIGYFKNWKSCLDSWMFNDPNNDDFVRRIRGRYLKRTNMVDQSRLEARSSVEKHSYGKHQSLYRLLRSQVRIQGGNRLFSVVDVPYSDYFVVSSRDYHRSLLLWNYSYSLRDKCPVQRNKFYYSNYQIK